MFVVHDTVRKALADEGLMIVPREPTQDMIEAACADYLDSAKHGPRAGRLWGSEVASLYKAMVRIGERFKLEE